MIGVDPEGPPSTWTVLEPKRPWGHDGKALRACIYKLPLVVFTGAGLFSCFVSLDYWISSRSMSPAMYQQGFAQPTLLYFTRRVFRDFSSFLAPILKFLLQIHQFGRMESRMSQKKWPKIGAKKCEFFLLLTDFCLIWHPDGPKKYIFHTFGANFLTGEVRWGEFEMKNRQIWRKNGQNWTKTDKLGLKWTKFRPNSAKDG